MRTDFIWTSGMGTLAVRTRTFDTLRPLSKRLSCTLKDDCQPGKKERRNEGERTPNISTEPSSIRERYILVAAIVIAITLGN
jgi:hypothetical protein